MIQFPIVAKLLSADWFLFSMLLTNLLRKVMPKSGALYSDALRNFVPFGQFKKREKNPMKECHF